MQQNISTYLALCPIHSRHRAGRGLRTAAQLVDLCETTWSAEPLAGSARSRSERPPCLLQKCKVHHVRLGLDFALCQSAQCGARYLETWTRREMQLLRLRLLCKLRALREGSPEGKEDPRKRSTRVGYV